MKKNSCFKARGKTFLIAVNIFFILFLASLSSAFEFDNVKVYNSDTKEVTLVNAFGFGNDIAKAKLNTPIVNYVGMGYQEVAEFEIESYDDYSELIKGFDLYNTRKNNEAIERNIDVKYLSYEEIIVDDYDESCDYYNSEILKKCAPKIIGTHKEQKEVWKDFDIKSNFPKGKLTIGLFTDVQKGDRVEWVPEIAGVKVLEWALWEEGMNAGMIGYWKLDETSGITANDEWDLNDLHIVSMVLNADGMINTGFQFDANSDYMNKSSPFGIVGATNICGNLWTNVTNADATDTFIDIYDSTGSDFDFQLRFWDSTTLLGVGVWDGASEYATIDYSSYFNSWTMITYCFNDTMQRVWLNGVSVINDTISFTFPYTAITWYSVGNNLLDIQRAPNGFIDEIGLWNRSLSQQEITILYNGGTPPEFNVTNLAPEVTPQTPADNYATSSLTNDFISYVTDDGVLANVSLYIDGSLDTTNSSGTNPANYTFSKTLTEGNHTWLMEACDDYGECTNGTSRTIVLDATSPTISSDVNQSTIYNEGDVILLRYNITDANLDKCWYNYNSADVFFTCGSELTFNITTTITDLEIEVNANDTAGNDDYQIVSLYLDSTAPKVSATYPAGTISYHEKNTNTTLNYTITDTNLDDCWYSYGGTNTTLNCSASYVNLLITDGTIKTLTVFANDSIGNVNSTILNWDYNLFLDSETYSSTGLEGSTKTFSATLLTNGTDISAAYLNYNGTDYAGSITQSGNQFTISKTQTLPEVSSDTNVTFYWNLLQGESKNLTSHTQLVKSLTMSNCTSGATLYNFTLKDEAAQTVINASAQNSTVRADIQLYSYDRSLSLANLTYLYDKTNPSAVCLSDNLTQGESYLLDGQIEYDGGDYANEFYHFQNETITHSDFPTAISLYDLLNSSMQEFEITYRDSSYIPVSDALVKVYRKYVDEGVFKIVEIPKTDSNGKALAHLVLNDVIYNFVIVKNGEILAEYNNVISVCQTPLVTSCVIDINEAPSSIEIPDFEDDEDFNFTIYYNETSRKVSSNFNIPSGTPATILLQVIKEDALGTSVCTDTLLSANGTLSCTVPAAIGNSTIRANLYKDGLFQAYGTVKIGQNSYNLYGASMVLLSVIVFITIVGVGISNNPIISLIFIVLGAIVLSALNLVSNTGFIGATATILWFLIVCILLIIKGARR